jgi:hypothetical protein
VGQTIEIRSTVAIDHVLVVDTDRSITGQDGVSFSGVETARRDDSFPAKLAVRLFEGVEGVDHVHLASNTVSVRRPGGWSDDRVEAARGIVSEFFRYYPGS